jgi:hypothetical protein
MVSMFVDGRHKDQFIMKNGISEQTKMWLSMEAKGEFFFNWLQQRLLWFAFKNRIFYFFHFFFYIVC